MNDLEEVLDQALNKDEDYDFDYAQKNNKPSGIPIKAYALSWLLDKNKGVVHLQLHGGKDWNKAYSAQEFIAISQVLKTGSAYLAKSKTVGYVIKAGT